MKKSNDSMHSMLLRFHGLDVEIYADMKEMQLVLENELIKFEVHSSAHIN